VGSRSLGDSGGGLGDRSRGGDGEADERGNDDRGTHLDDLEF
jgi:hypothetical protein